MSAPLESYLRTYRKRSDFSQDEIAFLLGCQSGAKVSRYERWTRRPSLETALAFTAIFQVPVEELFAGTYRKVEKKMVRRARALAEQLLTSGEPDDARARKLAILRRIALESSAAPEKRE